MSKPKPLTTAETAARLGITVASVRKAIERGRLRASRFGTTLAFDVAEVERYQRRQCWQTQKKGWKRIT